MAKFTVAKRPPPAHVIYAEYREEVRKDLAKVAKSHVRSREKIVKNWSARSKPKFKANTVVTVGKLAIEVEVEEKNKAKPIWKWVSQTGTKAHVIKPKAGNKWQRLFFMWGGPGSYEPKTRTNPARYGGAGKVRGGKLTVARQVKHPGFPPRKFDEKVNEDLKPDFEKAIENGGRRGLKKKLKSK